MNWALDCGGGFRQGWNVMMTADRSLTFALAGVCAARCHHTSVAVTTLAGALRKITTMKPLIYCACVAYGAAILHGTIAYLVCQLVRTTKIKPKKRPIELKLLAICHPSWFRLVVFISIFSGSTLLADTFYLNGVGVTNIAHPIVGPPPQLKVDHQESMTLFDPAGITSITLMPFLTVTDCDGQPLPTPTLQLWLWISGSYDFGFTGYSWTGEPVTISLRPFESWPYFTEGDAATDRITARWDTDISYNDIDYLTANPPSGPQIWTYGFDAISYTTVPEPPLDLLIICGGLLFVAFKRSKAALLVLACAGLALSSHAQTLEVKTSIPDVSDLRVVTKDFEFHVTLNDKKDVALFTFKRLDQALESFGSFTNTILNPKWKLYGPVTITNIGALMLTNTVNTNAINQAVTNGVVCSVRGHQWESGCGFIGCLVMHGDAPMRHCVICNKTERRELGPWK